MFRSQSTLGLLCEHKYLGSIPQNPRILILVWVIPAPKSNPLPRSLEVIDLITLIGSLSGASLWLHWCAMSSLPGIRRHVCHVSKSHTALRNSSVPTFLILALQMHAWLFMCVPEIWVQLLQIALQGHYWVSLSTKVSLQPRNLHVWCGRIAWCICPSSHWAPEWDYNAICIHCRAALFTWISYIFVNSIFLQLATCPPRSYESALPGNNATPGGLLLHDTYPRTKSLDDAFPDCVSDTHDWVS